MKTLLAMLLAFNLSANNGENYITTNYYDPSVLISFDAWKGETLSVKILDDNKEVIFTNVLDITASKGVKYNLKKLPAGKYTIKLEDSTKLVEETVILFDGKIVKKEAKEFFKPTIKIKEDNIIVNFLTFDGTAKVSIINDNTTVFSDKVENVTSFGKVYNISKLERGTYTIRVNNSKVSTTVEFVK